MDPSTCTLGNRDLDSEIFGYSNVDPDRLHTIHQRVMLGIKLDKIPLPCNKSLKIACQLADSDTYLMMFYSRGALFVPDYPPEELFANVARFESEQETNDFCYEVLKEAAEETARVAAGGTPRAQTAQQRFEAGPKRSAEAERVAKLTGKVVQFQKGVPFAGDGAKGAGKERDGSNRRGAGKGGKSAQ